MTTPAAVRIEDYIAALPEAAQIPLGLLELLAIALGLVGLPLLAVELWRRWREGRLDRKRWAGVGTSLFCALPATLVEVGLGAGLVMVFVTVSTVSPWSIPTSAGTAIVCLLLADLTYYVEHRLAHRVNLLWSAYHSVHHSGGHYDPSIAFRVSFVDFFFSPLIYLPLVWVGFEPLLVLGCLAFILAYQTWIHTELIGRLAWLDGWLNTPSNHRVHHARNAG